MARLTSRTDVSQMEELHNNQRWTLGVLRPFRRVKFAGFFPLQIESLMLPSDLLAFTPSQRCTLQLLRCH